MSNIMNIEFVQALNPLYAFPIVAVILCAVIVYAFGFKSPVQPPSFDGIEEERKVSKKRKTKEINKGKLIQNGKVNGSTSSKTHLLVSTKKKEIEKSLLAEKPPVEKAINEKKVIKRSKLSNEKKAIQDKKKENVSPEDPGEDGWVQLISKKGRKSRKKDDVGNTENQACIAKPVKNSQNNKPDDIIPSEETPKTDVIENSIPEKEITLKDEVNEVISTEKDKDNIVKIEAYETDDNLEKASFEADVLKSEKSNDETNTKSKKKKKKVLEVIHSNGITSTKSSTEQVISENSVSQSLTNCSSVTRGNLETVSDKVKENESKEKKSSNVVFDELAGLYPEPKEQRKKKRVRRDH